MFGLKNEQITLPARPSSDLITDGAGSDGPPPPIITRHE